MSTSTPARAPKEAPVSSGNCVHDNHDDEKVNDDANTLLTRVQPNTIISLCPVTLVGYTILSVVTEERQNGIYVHVMLQTKQVDVLTTTTTTTPTCFESFYDEMSMLVGPRFAYDEQQRSWTRFFFGAAVHAVESCAN